MFLGHLFLFKMIIFFRFVFVLVSQSIPQVGKRKSNNEDPPLWEFPWGRPGGADPLPFSFPFPGSTACKWKACLATEKETGESKENGGREHTHTDTRSNSLSREEDPAPRVLYHI